MRFVKGLFIVILVAVIILGFILFYVKDCKTDEACFNKALENCDRARLYKLREGNIVEYKVLGLKNSKCEIYVQMEKMQAGTDRELKAMFEGKDMICKISPEIFRFRELDQIENLINFCQGPLKEATQQLIIKKMYTLILINLADIIDEVEEITRTRII